MCVWIQLQRIFHSFECGNNQSTPTPRHSSAPPSFSIPFTGPLHFLIITNDTFQSEKPPKTIRVIRSNKSLQTELKQGATIFAFTSLPLIHTHYLPLPLSLDSAKGTKLIEITEICFRYSIIKKSPEHLRYVNAKIVASSTT